MCSINHSKKAIFIHIPKTGGSYIANILEKHYGFKSYYLQRPDHANFCNGKDRSVDKHENKIHGTLMYYKTSPHINKIINMTSKRWDEYFIFTFIRNPYDRIISGWNYCNRDNIPFDKYINITYGRYSYDYWHIYMPQSRHIVGNNGKININFIGKFENMENDLKDILKQIGFQYVIHIPFKKNEKKHKDYREYYNDVDVIQKVNKLIKEDLDNFDYIHK